MVGWTIEDELRHHVQLQARSSFTLQNRHLRSNYSYHVQLVRNCKDTLLEVLQSGNLDLLFANQEEAEALVAVMELASPEGGGRGHATVSSVVDC